MNRDITQTEVEDHSSLNLFNTDLSAELKSLTFLFLFRCSPTIAPSSFSPFSQAAMSLHHIHFKTMINWSISAFPLNVSPPRASPTLLFPSPTRKSSFLVRCTAGLLPDSRFFAAALAVLPPSSLPLLWLSFLLHLSSPDMFRCPF